MTMWHANSDYKDVMMDYGFEVFKGQPSIRYLHSVVVWVHGGAVAGEYDLLSAFLAEINAVSALCCGREKLVLGLKNHHIGGYYWA